MNYGEMPVIILLLASGYLLAIYALLMLAQRLSKVTQARSSDIKQI